MELLEMRDESLIDEWADYERHKRRSDYGCQWGCCGGEVNSSCLPVINE